MLDALRHILIDQREDLLPAWQKRVAKLANGVNEAQRADFVQELLAAVHLFLFDQNSDAALKRIDAVILTFFHSSREGADVVVNSLLILRYVLLGEMSRQKDCVVGNLQLFSFLNDKFHPLIVAISENYHSSAIRNRLPADFAPTCVANIQSMRFAGVGFFIIDHSENIIYWSPGAEDVLGLAAHDVVGRTIFNLLPEWHEGSVLHSLIKSALQEQTEKELFSVKQRIKKKKFVLDIKIVPMLDAKKNTAGCSVLVHDVTELKSRESELHRYEQFFENILNDAADAIVLLNEHDRITMWNKAAELVFGYREEDVVGKPMSIIFPDTTQARAELAEMDEAIREYGFLRRDRIQAVARDGHPVLAAITRTRLRNQNEDYIGSSVILRDVSQQEQLRQQVFQSEKLSAVGTLAAGIAHEVGTPLTSISSLTQIMQIKTNDPEFKEKLVVIQQSIERISRTVRTLVDFSRPAAEKIEPLYLNSVIEHVLRIIKYDKRLKHQKIITSFEPNIGIIRASFDQVLQVMINICLNAADAMEGEKDGVLEVKTWNNGEYVCATIKDNGPGIPQNKQRLIFDPFFTTKTNGRGTGLGLWVSYNIIKSFSGHIKVQSTPGHGAAFTIMLPRQES